MNPESLDNLLHNVVDTRMKELEQQLHNQIEQEIKHFNDRTTRGEEVAQLSNRIKWLTGALVFTYLLIIISALGAGTYYLRLQQSQQPVNVQPQSLPQVPANRTINP
ncbi:MAG: hypothetical protein VKL59_18940 [Nostocaceae cyanobacterium]|nr:hypothetical protein [Nostocaceae cyanobacterium]